MVHSSSSSSSSSSVPGNLTEAVFGLAAKISVIWSSVEGGITPWDSASKLVARLSEGRAKERDLGVEEKKKEEEGLRFPSVDVRRCLLDLLREWISSRN